jgi:DNA-binding transcriptional MerR regulator
MGVMEVVESLLDSAAMIDIAAAHDHKVTPRSLELWRYRGLLPRPERQASGRAVWLYPAGTERQLLRLLYWRGRTRNLDEVLLALWIEGFGIELDGVREALVRFVERWEAMIEAEVAGTSKRDEEALVDTLARKFARMRGAASLPRLSRMRSKDRERACGYLVAAMFGMEDELTKREGDLPHLERLLGFRRGHDGGLSPMLGLKDAKGQIARLPTPGEAREPVRTAQPIELEFARRVIQVFLFVLPAALPTLFADQAVKAVDVVNFARQSFTEPPPGLFPFLLTVFLVSLRGKEPEMGELREPLGALEPNVVRRELAKILPAAGAEAEAG